MLESSSGHPRKVALFTFQAPSQEAATAICSWRMVNLMLRHGRAPGFEEDESVVCADPDCYDARKDVHEGEEFDSEDKGVDEVGTTQRVSDRHHATESQVWSRDMAPNIWNIVKSKKYISWC